MSQTNAQSRVSQSGWLSDSFRLRRGCRQGDPISPYVFILCAELLSQCIINNKGIKGINIEGRERKLNQFADDTSLFLDGSKKSLRKAEESLLHLFCECDLSTQIWQEIVDWLGKQGQKINYLTDSQILLGDPSLDPVINRIIITTKVSIFKNKGGNPPNLIQILNSLKK